MSIKKTLTAAFAAACALSFAAKAAETETTETPIDYGPRSYGWTAIAFGLATPVQLPWGIDKWDVFGLDLNVFYSDAPRMMGWQIAAGGNVVRKDFIGIQTAALFNFSNKDSYGLSVAVFNMNNLEYYGLVVDAFQMNREFYGLSVDGLGNMTDKEMGGVSIAGLANVVGGEMYGVEIAGLCNLAKESNGLQLALLYNQTSLLWGAQIGLVNVAFECDHGIQIGLINVIMDNQWPFIPIVNWYFD